MFRRRNAGAADETAQQAAETPAPPSRPAAESAKGRPTPKRSVAEANRRQPIGGSRTAAPRTPEEKARARTARAGKYEAMKRGEAWALNPRDRGAPRALARDYVDAHRRVSEYYMYVLVVLLVAVFVRSTVTQEIVSPVVLVLLLIIIVDAQFIRRALNRLVAERLPGESTRGLTMYAVMRALQIRRFRVPAPRVGPGDEI